MDLPIEIKAEPRTGMDIWQSKEREFSPKEDVHVDILECANPDDYCREEEAVPQDITSSSSSFNDSICVPGDSGLGDEEAQSILCEEYPLPPSICDGTEFFCMRKKKLRDDWRHFIRPISWRCRWLELKVKEFQSQARKYKKEIADYYLTKQFELEKLNLEGNAVKSIPFPVQAQRVRVLNRRKRKRVEETTDVASYMSSHNLFSYAENRMPATAGPHHRQIERKCSRKENEVEDDSLVYEVKFSDEYVAGALQKIDEAWEKAKKLKKRVDELMCEPSIEIVNDSVHIEHLSIPEISAPVQNIEQQRLINISPSFFGDEKSIFPVFEDVEEEAEGEIATGEELDYFRKIINEVTGGVPRLSSEEPEAEGEKEEDPSLTTTTKEEDPSLTATTTISTRVKTRKRKKRQPSRISSSTRSRRSAALLRRKTTL
ncbi:PREDICTED: uncharacterized protein LOC104819250 isoform X2 [Tarenaya hassleriana]|uniref:uncharacterized protein LOC104819250 isoform X2 n=1 Tax=Tarenaya hassleriana TaxID=28532 RepID=UPI00053C94F3|nr:PREDICTED: uncharacterized protein LOC104819250 isoform X2 [Tarenaya hassleriana]